MTEATGEATDRPLAVVVCTCRADDLRKRWRHAIEQLRAGEYVVVIDHEETPAITMLAEEIRAHGGTVWMLGATHGLSFARNVALDRLPEHHVLFVDDDVLFDREAVAAVRRAFTAGAQVTGARLVPPPGMGPLPWYLTRGQMHLVGWHASADVVKVWGAFMGIAAPFAHRHGLRFDQRLGRTGWRLESGDDTSFVSAIKKCGGREVLLRSVHVVHDVDRGRLNLRYLLRRSYWQGRSEVRRGDFVTGLRKEWRRHRGFSPPGRALPLATVYVGAFLVGVSLEVLLSIGHRIMSRHGSEPVRPTCEHNTPRSGDAVRFVSTTAPRSRGAAEDDEWPGHVTAYPAGGVGAPVRRTSRRPSLIDSQGYRQ